MAKKKESLAAGSVTAEASMDRRKNLFCMGHSACAGCGPAILMRSIANTLGKDIIVVNATGCMEIVSSKYPESAWNVPYIHSLFENGPAVASGVARNLRANGNKHTRVVYIGGDGASYDIGFGALSGALERNEDILFIIYDTECYSNTGVQRSSATPRFANTTTSPVGSKLHGKQEQRKHIGLIAAAHNIAYVATASVGNLPDLKRKLQKAKETCGASVIIIYASCTFCWRDTSFTYPNWNIKEHGKKMAKMADAPDELLDEAVHQQRALLSGFKGYGKVDMQKWNEAQNPKHLAISLAGEPTLYPLISDLIAETKNRKMTSFLVTNGTNPNVLQEMESPTQLYVTVAAPNEDIYKRTCMPLQKQAWKNLNKTLGLFPSLSTRKVVRLTLAKKLNFLKPEEYAKMISKAEPDFVEVKAFMSVGFSRARMPYEDMPLHTEIQEFARKISEEISYPVIDEKKDSRVVLLSKSKRNIKIKKG